MKFVNDIFSDDFYIFNDREGKLFRFKYGKLETGNICLKIKIFIILKNQRLKNVVLF